MERSGGRGSVRRTSDRRGLRTTRLGWRCRTDGVLLRISWPAVRVATPNGFTGIPSDASNA
jgi:hypothetical protein